MVMLGAETDRYDAQANFTFSRHFAVGTSYMQIHTGGAYANFAFPQLNWLVKRWNNPDSQANVYFYGGLGFRNYKDTNKVAGFVGAEADYETRRFYTSIQQMSLLSDGINAYRTYVKVGGAPYLADYKQVATWLIFKTEYASYMKPEQKLSFIPGLRLFYKGWFVEGGYGVYGVWYANLMAVF